MERGERHQEMCRQTELNVSWGNEREYFEEESVSLSHRDAVLDGPGRRVGCSCKQGVGGGSWKTTLDWRRLIGGGQQAERLVS